jgi:hypothetical protein
VALDALVGDGDPAERIEAAHLTAAALVRRGRETRDPDLAARLVAFAEEHGLEEVAFLWARRPADTLPGALWRVYAVRAGIRRDPEGLAHAFDEGRRRAPVYEAVAGVAEPPGPKEVEVLADAILAGAFTGDLAVALERAGAFCRVVATGWAVLADGEPDHEAAMRLTRRAADLARTGTDLMTAASRWRRDSLH